MRDHDGVGRGLGRRHAGHARVVRAAGEDCGAVLGRGRGRARVRVEVRVRVRVEVGVRVRA